MRLRLLFPLTLPLLLVACGGLPSTELDLDGGQQSLDAGFVPMDGGTTSRHESYIPADQHPTSAARLIVMGDSISAGVGVTRASLTYFNLLTRNDGTWSDEANSTLSALFNVPDVPIVNVSVSGATTATALNQRGSLTQQLGATVAGHSIAVITIGGNDMKNLIVEKDESRVNATVNNAVSNVRQIINYLQDPVRFPDGVSIYLMAVYDPSDSSGSLPNTCFGVPVTNQLLVTGLENLKTRYVALGTELGFAVVDALGHFHGHGVIASQPSNPYYNADNPVTWFSDDCIHPNNAGHNELRRLFFEAIAVGTYVATDV